MFHPSGFTIARAAAGIKHQMSLGPSIPPITHHSSPATRGFAPLWRWPGFGAILSCMFYLDLFRALQEEQVNYVVVGGLVINLHGVERATMDVDLVLAMDDANLRRFLNAATRLKRKPSYPFRSKCCAMRSSAIPGSRRNA